MQIFTCARKNMAMVGRPCRSWTFQKFAVASFLTKSHYGAQNKGRACRQADNGGGVMGSVRDVAVTVAGQFRSRVSDGNCDVGGQGSGGCPPEGVLVLILEQMQPERSVF